MLNLNKDYNLLPDTSPPTFPRSMFIFYKTTILHVSTPSSLRFKWFPQLSRMFFLSLHHHHQESICFLDLSRMLLLCLSTAIIAYGSFDISRMGLPFLHHGLQESICFLDVSRMLLLSLSAFSQQLLMVLLTSDIWFLLLFLLSTITICACRAEQRQLRQRMF